MLKTVYSNRAIRIINIDDIVLFYAYIVRTWFVFTGEKKTKQTAQHEEAHNFMQGPTTAKLSSNRLGGAQDGPGGNSELIPMHNACAHGATRYDKIHG